MDKFLEIMLFILVILVILSLLTIPIAFLITEIEDQIKKYKCKKYFGANNEILQQRILDHFYLKYNTEKDIPILFGEEEYFKENFPTACGLCSYKTYGHDLSTAHDFILRIRGKFNSFQWTTLAHEIGHYISIINYIDSSEEGADHEAGLFMLDMLSKEEQKLLHISLNICFKVGTDEFKSFQHKKENAINNKVAKIYDALLLNRTKDCDLDV